VLTVALRLLVLKDSFCPVKYSRANATGAVELLLNLILDRVCIVLACPSVKTLTLRIATLLVPAWTGLVDACDTCVLL